MKKSFRNDEDLFDSRGRGVFWQFGRYVDWLDMRYPNGIIGKMHLVSRLSDSEGKVVAVGLRQINKYMKSNELEFGEK